MEKIIEKLINTHSIEIYFQPIVSIKDKRIFAFEALTRAFDENNNPISPIVLFQKAIEEKSVNTLDAYVRDLALQKFTKYHKKDKNILLFLNFESSFVENQQYYSFVENVQKYNIDPASIVLEIKEDKIKNTTIIENFVHFYRQYNFIIAIDDFGTGYSSFDRLSLIQPNIVKVDRSLIMDVHKNFINAEILRAISNMCHKIGAIVLAEGVERKEEILESMTKDIDIYQGFYFSKPLPKIILSKKNSLFKEMQDIGLMHKKEVNLSIKVKKSFFSKSEKLVTIFQKIYTQYGKESVQKIEKIVNHHKTLEAIYLIDFKTGLQKYNTIINTKKNTLFHPTKQNHDHNLKEYYFVAKHSSRSNYLSGIYVSKASGSMCRTYSSIISIKKKKYILCLDIKEKE